VDVVEDKAENLKEGIKDKAIHLKDNVVEKIE